jgi:hypothetical protein
VGTELDSFLNNRWITAISLLLNLVGVFSGFYFYIASQKTRQLSFYINPNRTTVVSPTNISSLQVLFDGRELKGSVTAVQVSAWNAGAEAIPREAILDSVIIKTQPATQILAVSIQKMSQEATKFAYFLHQPTIKSWLTANTSRI